MSVVGETVQFDHDPVTWPGSIDLHAQNGRVADWSRQAVGVTECRELALERRSADIGCPSIAEDRSNRLQSVPSPGALDDLLQHSHLKQVEAVSLLAGASQLRGAHDFGEVEECAGRVGDRNPVLDDYVNRFSLAPVKDDPGSAHPTATGCDIDRRSLRAEDAPERCCAAVTENGVIPVCQYGGHPSPAPRDSRMAQRVDPLMDPV